MLKNIQHPVHVWATSNINQTSSAMSSTDDDPKSKLVLVPIKVDPSISALQPACDRLIDSMFEVLSAKTGLKHLLTKTQEKMTIQLIYELIQLQAKSNSLLIYLDHQVM